MTAILRLWKCSSHRSDHYMLGVHPATDEQAESEKIIRWGRNCWDAMQPFFERAVSLNGLEDALEEGEQRLRGASPNTTMQR